MKELVHIINVYNILAIFTSVNMNLGFVPTCVMAAVLPSGVSLLSQFGLYFL